MDKLKEQLAVAGKYWFWIATAMVTLISLLGWWMASSRLDAEFESASNKISGDAQKITSVRSMIPEHPSEKTHQEMEKLIESRKEAVVDAWESIYERQQAIFVWPVDELQDDFVREFKDLIPIELKVAFPTLEEDEKDTSLLNRYRFYIENALPKIAEIAKTKWVAKFDAVGGGYGMDGGGYGGDYGGEYDGGYGGAMPGMGSPESYLTGRDDGPLVQWDGGSQNMLLQDLFPWRGGMPKTLDVLYSQENLWILRQMMQIIATVNGDVGQRFQAKIRQINRLAIGKSVPKTAGTVSKPVNEAAGGMMGGDYGEYGDDGDYGDGGDYGEYGGDDMGMMGGPMGVTLDPGDNRYVDTQGKPVTAEQMRAALSSNSPTDAFMAVAKRVPVMMSFKMDQRAVPELLAACGSAPLMVEVRQVRILPPGMNTSSTGGYGDDMGGGGYDEGMMDDSGEGYGGGYGMGVGMGTGAPRADEFPLDMNVEIYGIIYVYNPPDVMKLGVDQVDENTVIEGTSMRDGSKLDLPAPAVAPATADATPTPLPSEPVPADSVPSEPAAADPAPAEPAPAEAPAAETAPPTQPAAAQPGGADTSFRSRYSRPMIADVRRLVPASWGARRV